MARLNILLSGSGGRLGTSIVETVAARPDCCIVAGVDINPYKARYTADSFPVFPHPAEYTGDCDVIIDCSHHSAVTDLLRYATEHKKPVVIATTGHTEEETALISAAAKTIPVFYSRNMSVGINLLIALARRAAEVLGTDFDVEIIEQHHNQKLDAPSGTALMLADAIASAEPYDAEYTYDRHAVRRAREKQEIGIHSVRGGTIVGEHEVIFAGKDEVIRLAHSAASREVFAQGAVRAALYLAGRTPGLYAMSDIVDTMIG